MRRALESWAGSTSVLHTWPLIPWVVDAIGPTSSSAPNEEFRPTKPKKAALFYSQFFFPQHSPLCVYSPPPLLFMFLDIFVPSSFSDSRFWKKAGANPKLFYSCKILLYIVSVSVSMSKLENVNCYPYIQPWYWSYICNTNKCSNNWNLTFMWAILDTNAPDTLAYLSLVML